MALLKNFISRANSQGIPIPMLRYKGEGNPAFTLMIISALLVIIGIVGKWSGHLGGIDTSTALQFFYASSTLFFGHSWVHREDPMAPVYPPVIPNPPINPNNLPPIYPPFKDGGP